MPTLHPVYDKLADIVSVVFWQPKDLLPHTSTDSTTMTTTPAHIRLQRARQQEQKKSFWSAITPSFGSDEVHEHEKADPPRTLEDAANLAYPPAAIWNPAVRQHSRVPRL